MFIRKEELNKLVNNQKDLIKSVKDLKKKNSKLVEYLRVEKEKFVNHNKLGSLYGFDVVGKDFIDWRYKKIIKK